MHGKATLGVGAGMMALDRVVIPPYKWWCSYTENTMSINDPILGPKELEPLCGFDALMLKEWRRLKLLEGFGKLGENGRWKYTVREAVKLAICNSLRLAGLPGHVAIKVGWDIHDDVLKAAEFYGSKFQPDFNLLAIWNNEASGEGVQGLTSRYLPWSSYPADDWAEIYQFIDAPAPIVADLHKLSVAFPKPLIAALQDAMKELASDRKKMGLS
jgi:hypothetical protein